MFKLHSQSRLHFIVRPISLLSIAQKLLPVFLLLSDLKWLKCFHLKKNQEKAPPDGPISLFATSTSLRRSLKHWKKKDIWLGLGLGKKSQAACPQHSESQTLAVWYVDTRLMFNWNTRARLYLNHANYVISSIVLPCYIMFFLSCLDICWHFVPDGLRMSSSTVWLWVCSTSSSKRFTFLSQPALPFSGIASTWPQRRYGVTFAFASSQRSRGQARLWRSPCLLSYPLRGIGQICEERC